MQALTRAADRGIKGRIYLDGAWLAEREPAKVFHDLAETLGVEIRTKHKRTAASRRQSCTNSRNVVISLPPGSAKRFCLPSIIHAPPHICRASGRSQKPVVFRFVVE
jgi:hypothetical protein